jgi:hypothetical protein
MKILFLMLNAGYVRNYEAAIRQLAERGHRIHVAHQADRNKMGEKTFLDGLSQEFASVTGGLAPEPEQGDWRSFARTVRMLLDYTRYLDPRYSRAVALRERMAQQLPQGLVRVARAVAVCGAPARALFMRALLWAEWRVPGSRTVQTFLDQHAPDLVLVTPLVEPASIQSDYVKECAMRAIPTALCVASWDNLTNKGHIRVVPDRVIVWNEAQRREAVELHGVPAERVIISGSQMFDHWFDWKPRRSREEFCARVGLDPARPFILYLGSSYFIAPNEVAFVERWIQALKSARNGLQEAGILIRPHPANSQQFLGLDLSQAPGMTIWPPFSATFYEQDSKEDFFDSLHHCAAVVGVNTSALIEAAIVGRSVCTVLAPDFEHSQQGTLHFQLLSGGDSALVKVAPDFETHLEQLAEAVSPTQADRERIAAFVRSFVRPHGLDRPATPFLVDAIEEISALKVQARVASPLDPFWRLLVQPLSAISALLWLVFDSRTGSARAISEYVAQRWARLWLGWHLGWIDLQLSPQVQSFSVKAWPTFGMGPRRQSSVAAADRQAKDKRRRQLYELKQRGRREALAAKAVARRAKEQRVEVPRARRLGSPTMAWPLAWKPWSKMGGASRASVYRWRKRIRQAALTAVARGRKRIRKAALTAVARGAGLVRRLKGST